MSVETATYISQLNPSYPAAGDPKSEGDDHLRLTKQVLQNQFTNLGTTAVTATAAQLNDVPNKANKTGDTYTGTHDLTIATVRVATQSATDSSTLAASTAQVQAAILASSGITAALPGQGGNAGKFLQTNGTSPTWQPEGGAVTVVSGTTQTAVAGNQYALTNASASTLTLPATPAAGDTVVVCIGNSRTDNIIARNGSTIMGLSEDMTIDNANATVTLRYLNGTWRLV